MGFSPISFEVDGIGFEHESSCIHLKTIPTERKKIILLWFISAVIRNLKFSLFLYLFSILSNLALV